MNIFDMLIGRIAENLPPLEGEAMKKWIDNPMKLKNFLLGLSTASQEEDPLDTIICVDRSVDSVCLNLAKEVIHYKLGTVGPTKYDLVKVELYLHDDQKEGGCMNGTKLYRYLEETDSLKNCLGFHDALKIQKKKIKVFRKVFGRGKTVFFWKSVARHPDYRLYVPFVSDGGNEVVVGWTRLDNNWDGSCPAARFAS